MRRLLDEGFEITIDNMVMSLAKKDERLTAFVIKHYGGKKEDVGKHLPTANGIYDVLFDTTLDSSERLFDEARRGILQASWTRFVEVAISDMKYYNSYNFEKYNHTIMSRARAILKLYDKLISNGGEIRNQLAETQHIVNSIEEYVPTCSRMLNSYIGGFSRGYVSTIIAKSSHCKSSWVDFNIVQNLCAGKIQKVVKITPEEDAPTQIKRYVATLCKVSLQQMLLKNVTITAEHLNVVREKLEIGNRLIIIDNVSKLNDVIESMASIKDADMVYIDHINAITYPGNGTWLNNMIGGIPGLVQFEKMYAKRLNAKGLKTCVINLSQVGDKEINKSDRFIKAPRFFDAYGSSSLYQASRQMLALWYPYKDTEDSPYDNMNIALPGGGSPSEIDVYASIEKSSFSRIGKMWWVYNPDYNLFSDRSVKGMEKKMDYVAPQETMDF